MDDASLVCHVQSVGDLPPDLGQSVDVIAADIGTGTDRIDVSLQTTRAVRSPLVDAIPSRQCSRSVYDAKPLSTGELGLLEQAAAASGVDLIVITDRARMDTVLEYVVRGNEAQIGDPAFVSELRSWIRFNTADAAWARDGLFSGCTGNPTVPGVCDRRLVRIEADHRGANEHPRHGNGRSARAGPTRR